MEYLIVAGALSVLCVALFRASARRQNKPARLAGVITALASLLFLILFFATLPAPWSWGLSVFFVFLMIFITRNQWLDLFYGLRAILGHEFYVGRAIQLHDDDGTWGEITRMGLFHIGVKTSKHMELTLANRQLRYMEIPAEQEVAVEIELSFPDVPESDLSERTRMLEAIASMSPYASAYRRAQVRLRMTEEGPIILIRAFASRVIWVEDLQSDILAQCHEHFSVFGART